MVDVRDLKWEVLKQTQHEKFCVWRKVQISYYDMLFHTFVTDDMFNEPEFLVKQLLECQRYVLKAIGHELERTMKHEMKHQPLH